MCIRDRRKLSTNSEYWYSGSTGDLTEPQLSCNVIPIFDKIFSIGGVVFRYRRRHRKPARQLQLRSARRYTGAGEATLEQAGHKRYWTSVSTVSYTHLRAHETPEHLVCRL